VGVLRIVHVAVAEPVDVPLIALDEEVEGRPLAPLASLHRLAVIHAEPRGDRPRQAGADREGRRQGVVHHRPQSGPEAAGSPEGPGVLLEERRPDGDEARRRDPIPDRPAPIPRRPIGRSAIPAWPGPGGRRRAPHPVLPSSGPRPATPRPLPPAIPSWPCRCP